MSIKIYRIEFEFIMTWNHLRIYYKDIFKKGDIVEISKKYIN